MPITIGGGGLEPLPSTQFLGGYGALNRMAKRYYDPARSWRNTSPRRQGTVSGGLTYDHVADLTYNPMKYTVLSPSRELTKPILFGQGEQTRPRTGSFTLDMIDWNANLAQLSGSTIGRDTPLLGPGGQAKATGWPDAIADPMQFLTDKDIDVFRNAPARLFDYATSPIHLGMKALGLTTPTGDDDEIGHFYNFQKESSYWQWLRNSTPDQRQQVAQFHADNALDRSRNAYLRDDVARQFELDYKSLDGLSSGNARFDYFAKKALQRGMERGSRYVLDSPYSLGEAIMVGPDGRPDMGGMSGIGTLPAAFLPFVGTEVALGIDPVSERAEEAWQALDPTIRNQLLGRGGAAAMVGDLMAMVPMFSGIGVVVNLGKAGAFGSIAARHGASAAAAARIGKGGEVAAKLYERSWRVTNGLMATGLVVATGNWALSAASPVYSESLGREIDASRVVSGSVLAGVINTTGYFTGFYGIDAAVPALYRAARGTGLASQTAGFIKGGLNRPIPKPTVNPRPADLSFHREMGGAPLGNILANKYGITHELQGTALSVEFVSTLIKGRVAEFANAVGVVARGGRSGLPYIDNLPDLDARLAELEGILANPMSRIHGNLALYANTVNARLLDFGVNPGATVRALQDKLNRGARQVDDEATQTMMGTYGAGYWPQFIAGADGLEDLVRKYLRGLGASDDTAAVASWAGKDVMRWQMAARRLHQIEFHARNAEMHTAAEGSLEAARIGMVSQRHLFSDEVEDLANGLVDPDAAAGQALMNDLIKTKADVQLLHAKGEFSTPEELAALLIQIAPVLPSRRMVGPHAADGLLNDFQRGLDAEGFWTIGFKPTGKFSLPEGWVTSDMPPPPGVERVALTPDQLRGMGYRPFGEGGKEYMTGTEFSKRDPQWPLAEYGAGAWIRAIPGEQVQRNAGHPAAFGGYSGVAGGDSQSQRMDDYLVDENIWTEPGSYAEDPNYLTLDQSLDPMTGQPVIRRGGNPGAEWPVLMDKYNPDEQFIFKARRGNSNGDPLTDLNPARRLSAPLVGKIMNYLGLPTAPEIPFTWQGIKGTIQKMLDGVDPVPLDEASLTKYLQDNPTYLETMQENIVVDWLTSQHDTNNGSFLAYSGDNRPTAIDKGQAWSYFGKPDEVAAFNDPTGAAYWGWRSPMALEAHLGEYLVDWMRNTGVVLNRQAVEPLLQKIEAIPDNVFRGWLRPLAEARVATGRFESDVDEFIDLMVTRKDGLRAATNRGYEHIGGFGIAKPGEPQLFKPGAMGAYHVTGAGPDVNSPKAVSGWDDFPEPPDTTNAINKVGVVIEEWDGRMWVVDSKGNYQGHLATYPKGRLDAQDLVDPLAYPPGQSPDPMHSLRRAAVREVEEETGFSIQLTGHLVDVTNEKGQIVRYYRATRTGGGPRWAGPKETENVVLVNAEQARARLVRDDGSGNWNPDQEQQDVLEALLASKAPATPDPGLPPAAPLDADPGMPGDPLPDGEEFLSYVKLPSGGVFRTPWHDYPMSMPDNINMGNRGVFMQKFDDVFRGWRTYRMAETQRAMLHRRLSRVGVGITPAKIDLLHTKILSLASEHRVPPQAFVLARDWMPFASKAYKELEDEVEKILGKGPFLGRDGKLVTPDWRREISRSYQTALKLNLTAGMTSRMYTMGGTGAAASFASHVIYPAFRFALSPIFKGGEHVESWALNALRGINPMGGDPYTEMLMFEGGIGHSRGQIRSELASDPMLQGLGPSFVYADGDTPTARALFFSTPVGPGITERARARMNGQDKPPGIMDQLYDHPVDEDLYPALYSDNTPEVLLPHRTDPDGTIIIERDGRAFDDAIIGKRFETWIGEQVAKSLDDPDAGLHRFAAGLAFVQSLGDDFVDRLVGAMTPMHHMNSTGTPGIDLLRQALEEGRSPLAGWPGRGRADVESAPLVGEAGGTRSEPASPNVSDTERLLGHVDAYYAGQGEWQGGSGTGVGVVMRVKTYKDAVISTGDRMTEFSSGPSDLRDVILTPAGAYRALRQRLFQSLHSLGAGSSSLTAYGQKGPVNLLERRLPGFNAMDPIEIAVPGGSAWDDIEALILREDAVTDWLDLVATHGNDIPALRDIKVIPRSTGGSIDDALQGYWIEKAGLNDRALLDNTDRFIAEPVGSFAHLIPDELVTPETAPGIVSALVDDGNNSTLLAALGETAWDGSTRFWMANNLEDELGRMVRQLDDQVREGRASWENQIIRPSHTQADVDRLQGDLDNRLFRLEEAATLLRDVRDWRGGEVGSRFDDVRSAREALAANPNDKAATAWLAGWHELWTARYLQLDRSTIYRGGTSVQSDIRSPQHAPTPGDPDIGEYLMSRRSSGVYDRATEDVALDLPPVGADPIAPDAVDAQIVAYAKDLLARYRAAVPDGYRRTKASDWEGMLLHDAQQVPVFAREMAPVPFREGLRARAAAKGGVDPGQPIVNVWIRGDRAQLKTDRTGGEVVISVVGPDGQPYGGMSLDEVAAVWRETGLPSFQSGLLEHGDPRDAMRSQGFAALWFPDGGPHGSIVSYADSFALPTGKGDDLRIDADATGFRTVRDDSLPPERRLPLRFAYAFRPEGNKDFVNATSATGRGYGADIAFVRSADVETIDFMRMPFDGPTGFELRGKQVTYSRFADTKMPAEWTYYHAEYAGLEVAQVDAGTIRSYTAADQLIDDLLVRLDGIGRPVSVELGANNDLLLQTLRTRMTRGDIPDEWVFVKAGYQWDPAGLNSRFREVIDEDEWLRIGGVPESIIDLTPEPPPSRLEDIEGGSEHLTEAIVTRWRDEIAKAPGAAKKKLERGFEAFWNPVPSKELQQDRLIQSIVARWYPEMLQQFIPDMYAFMRQKVGVPDEKMVAYLIEDRKLLMRWLKTESRTDFDRLVMHSDKYKAGGTREELDSLYAKPEWNDMMEVLRMTMRQASDEAFGVHFFNPHRSSFERSINHPLLGVYPASWAYKVTKEWWRFLYNNDMISGFRLGMAPAQYIANLQRQQSIAFAQNSDTDLEQWYEDGPLGSTIFMFNLLLPGDWSALPFPLSRSIRDALRGQLDPTVHFRNNFVGMGLGRDIRLATELAGEWGDLATGNVGPLREGEKREETYFRR